MPFIPFIRIKMFGLRTAIRVTNRGLGSVFRLFKVPMRSITSIQRPEYPYDDTDDLVDDEYYEVMEEEAIDELEEAALESSPVRFFRLDLCVVSLPTDELAAQADPKRSIDRYKASRLLRFIFSEMLIPRDAV